jgi:L-asparaginase
MYFYSVKPKMQSLSNHAVGQGPESESKLVVLATGGTIAGTADSATDNTGYVAAQLGVEHLLAAVPALPALLASQARPCTLVGEQLAQLDSKDMSHEVWRKLALRVAELLADPSVRGIVITHGTDTLEETAYFLHRVLAPTKPVVLTAAMRPATSMHADGPQNLLDACSVALHPGAQGVVVAFASVVWAGAEVRKAHTYRIEAFDGGDASPLARLEDGVLTQLRPWPGQLRSLGMPAGIVSAMLELPALGPEVLKPLPWPSVQLVFNHAGADGSVVDALLALGTQQPFAAVRGLVVAGTGNCTLHETLEAALERASRSGVQVLRATRVARGGVRDKAGEAWLNAGSLTPAQARVELLLRLLSAEAGAQGD